MTGSNRIRVVTEPSREYLNERQLLDYRTTRENSIKWLLTFGKNPEKVEAYTETTVGGRAARMDYFYRWVRDEEGRYIATPTQEHADEFLKQLAYEDRSNADRAQYQKALQMLFKWRHHEHGEDEYSPALNFYADDGATQPRNYLSREERTSSEMPPWNMDRYRRTTTSPDQRDR